jgi:tRNA uridine 5-carboxymethylaminomethyl modification enzyme
MRYGRELGLVSDGVWQEFMERQDRIGQVMAFLKKTRVRTRSGDRVSGYEYLKKPEIGLKDVLEYGKLPFEPSDEELRTVESETKYEGYIRKQEREIAKAMKSNSMSIPGDLDFRVIPGLTREAVERLEKKRPATLGEAGKLPGVTPAAVQSLALRLEILRKKGLPGATVPRETGQDDE